MEQTQKREESIIQPIYLKLLNGEDVIFRPCGHSENNNTRKP